MYGVPLDQAKQETKYIDNNGEEIKWTEKLPNYCKRDKWILCIIRVIIVCVCNFNNVETHDLLR